MSQPALRLQLVPDEPDQVLCLARFRQEHPDVIIGEGGFGTWQARIPEPDGETVTTRHTLQELLDRLGELTADQGGHVYSGVLRALAEGLGADTDVASLQPRAVAAWFTPQWGERSPCRSAWGLRGPACCRPCWCRWPR
ncbi:MAG: hypothetical protein ACRDOD_00255 [Streptosporangiaceae bacterium]